MPKSYKRIRTELDRAEAADASTALTHLRAVLDIVSELIDEQLVRAVLDEEMSLRSAGAKAGLTENAVGPRLARSPLLAGYARDGRVTAGEVKRARYDREIGVPPPPASQIPESHQMRFKPRRNT